MPTTTTTPGTQKDKGLYQGLPKVTTRDEAEVLARALRSEGRTYQQIATALTARGWRSSKGGPVSIGGVASLLGTRPPATSRRARVDPGTPLRREEPVAGEGTGGDGEMIDLIVRLLSQKSLSAEDRIAVVLLIIEGGKKS